MSERMTDEDFERLQECERLRKEYEEPIDGKPCIYHGQFFTLDMPSVCVWCQRDTAEAHARELYEDGLDAGRRYKTEIDEAEARVAELERMAERTVYALTEYADAHGSTLHDVGAWQRHAKDVGASVSKALAAKAKTGGGG